MSAWNPSKDRGRCARGAACDTRASTLWLFGCHHSSEPGVDGALVSGWFYDVKKSHSVLRKQRRAPNDDARTGASHQFFFSVDVKVVRRTETDDVM